MAKLYQVAAMPIRNRRDGAPEVLLVTSRETRRWVVPKGWPWKKVADHDAAAGEAWEEAGVGGKVERRSIGSFTYDKLRNGKPFKLKVLVYILEVEQEAETWPEAGERKRAWFSAADAAEMVSEAGLKLLLRALARDP